MLYQIRNLTFYDAALNGASLYLYNKYLGVVNESINISPDLSFTCYGCELHGGALHPIELPINRHRFFISGDIIVLHYFYFYKLTNIWKCYPFEIA